MSAMLRCDPEARRARNHFAPHRECGGMTRAPRPDGESASDYDRKRCGGCVKRQDRLPQMLDQHASDARAHGAGTRRPISQRGLEPAVNNPRECRIGFAHWTTHRLR